MKNTQHETRSNTHPLHEKKKGTHPIEMNTFFLVCRKP